VKYQIQNHPRYHELFQAIRENRSQLTIAWDQAVYRSVDLKWANPAHLIDGAGTLKHGSRWMLHQQTAVVHASSTESIALKESRQRLKRSGIRRPKKKPRVIVEISARLHRVLDLKLLTRHSPWLEMNELMLEDWEKINDRQFESLSQALGRAAWSINCEGLVVPSVADGRGRNLIWFPQKLLKDSKLEISGEKELKQGLAQ